MTIIINRATDLHNKAAAHVDFSMHTIALCSYMKKKKNLFISHRVTVSSFLVFHLVLHLDEEQIAHMQGTKI